MKTLEQKAREYISKQCGLTPKDSYYNNIQNAFIAGYAEALRWRDVNNEPPPELNSVLVKNNHCPCQEFYIQEAFLDNGVWQCPITGSALIGSITHWRPSETI